MSYFSGLNNGDVVRLIRSDDLSVIGIIEAADDKSVCVGPYDNDELSSILGDPTSGAINGYKIPTITNWSVTWPTIVLDTYIKEIIILKRGKNFQ